MDAFDPEIINDFLTESGELLEQLETDLVELESDAENFDLLNQIFRALHTIKGSASFLALTPLVEIAHATESALNMARNGEIVVGRGEMDLLLEATDVLRAQFEQLNAGETELVAAEPKLVGTLAAIGEGKQAGEVGGDAQAATATADPAGASETSTGPTTTADGATISPLALDGAQADLLEHMAADLDATLDDIQSKLDELADEVNRPGAASALAELGDDLVRTIEFFEFEGMLRLARTLSDSAEQLAELDADSFGQAAPRLNAVRSLLAEQGEGIKNGQMIERPVEHLLDRLGAAVGGMGLEDDEKLGEACDVDAVLAADGVVCDATEDATDDATVDAPETTASQPADAAPAEAPQEAKVTPAPAAPAAGKKTKAAPEQTIRVEVGRLEELMNLVGELVLQKNRVRALSDDIDRSDLDSALTEQIHMTADSLDRVTGDIQTAVMHTRLQPLDKLFGKYPRLIRDLAKKTNKQIRLEIEGGETEVDKSVIEEFGDPMVHLLRNSADHGIEMPDDRTAAGKEPEGVIRLCARHEGSHVRVEIIDDGCGLPRDRIAAKAVERGLTTEEQVQTLSDEEIFRFILEPGFSTAAAVSDLSGRGVGMDVVRTNIERKLKGSISIHSSAGKGTTISIAIPLTVAIMPAMMVHVADEVFAIPLGSITEIVRPTGEELDTVGENPVIRLRGAVLPLISAQGVFDVPAEHRADEPFVVVLAMNDRLIGLRVTSVVGQQEIVIKPLDGIERTGPVSGATVRNDGGVSLIMDVAELMRTSKQ